MKEGIPGDQAGGQWRELSPWSLGHWIPESLRYRIKEAQGTKGSAEDPSAVQGENRLLLKDAEEIQLARI